MKDLSNFNKHFDELMHHLNMLATEMVRQSQMSQMENLCETPNPEAECNAEHISEKDVKKNEKST